MTAKPAPKPTSAKAWKTALYTTVELPSGNIIKLKKLGMQSLLASGVIPNSLLGIIQSALTKGRGMEDAALAEMAKDPKQLQDMMNMMDRLIVAVAVEPRIYAVPKNSEERDDELIYSDEVNEVDKSFIFQLVSGGTSDLEEFRKEHAKGVESISGR